MNRLIYLLIKEGAALLISRDIMRRTLQRMTRAFAFYAALSLLALVALIFLYIFLDRWLSESLGGTSAAAILCGANLALIGLVLIGRALLRMRQQSPANRSALNRSIMSTLSENPNLEAGLAIGRNLGNSLRKAAPEIAIAAAILGVIIGIRPFFRRKPAEKKDK